MRVLAWPSSVQRHQPYIVQLYTHLEERGVEVTNFHPRRLVGKPFDIWHMHWPENRLIDPNPLWAGVMASRLMGEMLVAKALGTKIIWTAHNLSQHEKRHPHMEPWFWRAFTRLIDGWIALSPSGKRLAEAKFPALKNKPSFHIPHGHYRDHYSNAFSREEARRKLDIPDSARVISSVGHIRAYKNIPHLINTFCQVPDEDLVLLIAGRVKDAWIRNAIYKAAGDDPRVRLRLEFVPDDDVSLYMRASDLVALPYTDILNSSSALLALTFNVPVLVPTRGAMQDLQHYAGPSWVRTFEDDLTPEDLDQAIAWSTDPRETLTLNELNWDRLAEQTLSAYQAVQSGVPSRIPETVRLPNPIAVRGHKPSPSSNRVRILQDKRSPNTTHKDLQGPRP